MIHDRVDRVALSKVGIVKPISAMISDDLRARRRSLTQDREGLVECYEMLKAMFESYLSGSSRRGSGGRTEIWTLGGLMTTTLMTRIVH